MVAAAAGRPAFPLARSDSGRCCGKAVAAQRTSTIVEPTTAGMLTCIWTLLNSSVSSTICYRRGGASENSRRLWSEAGGFRPPTHHPAIGQPHRVAGIRSLGGWCAPRFQPHGSRLSILDNHRNGHAAIVVVLRSNGVAPGRQADQSGTFIDVCGRIPDELELCAVGGVDDIVSVRVVVEEFAHLPRLGCRINPQIASSDKIQLSWR